MVQVLMSAYNGEKYIREQLDSILAQSYSDINILIRDDGSEDGTLDILKEYSDNYPNVNYYAGDNIGVQKSFFDLFSHMDDNAAYVATCDQDDVWYPDKIEAAVKQLQELNGPALYCCRTQLTDAKLVPIEDNIRDYKPRISFGNALIENICTGCTLVVNKEFCELIQGKFPNRSVIHDWWFYQVALCFGKVIYDDTPHVFYRQHEGNVIGLDHSRFALVKRQLHSLKKFKGTYTAQMQEFLDTFTLEGENKYLAELMVGTRTSWKCRWRILFEKAIFRQGTIDTILFKGMLFWGIL